MLFSWNPSHKLMAIETQKPQPSKLMATLPPSPRQPPTFTTINPHMTHNKNSTPSTTMTTTPNSTTMNPQKKKKKKSSQNLHKRNPPLPQPTFAMPHPYLPRLIHLCHDPPISPRRDLAEKNTTIVTLPCRDPPQTGHHYTPRETRSGRWRDRVGVRERGLKERENHWRRKEDWKT